MYTTACIYSGQAYDFMVKEVDIHFMKGYIVFTINYRGCQKFRHSCNFDVILWIKELLIF